MKTRITALILTVCLPFFGKTQETVNTGFGFGMQLVEYQNDFGIGLNLTSPYFAYDKIGVRLKGNVMYHQAVIDGRTDWIQYSNFSLGLIGVGGHVTERIRLYGEGGVIAVLPSGLMSDEDATLGGYGIFGFEFFFERFGNYFVEIGGVGSGAVADNLVNEPIYSNGMILSTGFRFFLK